VAEVVAGDSWVFDGAPYWVEALVYPRADAVVALDYPRRTVMWRVIWRSLRQPDPRSWRDPEHPVRWAWSVWAERRRESAALELPHASIIRLRSSREARAWLNQLRADGARTSTRPSAESARP